MAVKIDFEKMMLRKMNERGRLMTLDEMAEEAGVSRQSMSSWKRGELEMFRVSTLEKLCKYFKCQVGDLMYTVPDYREEHAPPTPGGD